ncbi:hypothetical protein [Porphyromonas gingivalis]|uniref:hypothetical protein n=1 Tax=Porphyromonas gingivalis TaxID=837 RepID=UPI000A888530|nr:hypothetical protein [Porphyromonas gingivalis]
MTIEGGTERKLSFNPTEKSTRWNDFYQVWAKTSAKDNKMTNKWQIPEENLWNIKKNHEYCS